MTITTQAVYEGGVLKPSTPLDLREHEVVVVSVTRTADEPVDPPSLPFDPEALQKMAGMMKWTGSQEELRRLAEDEEFGIMESP